MHSSGPAANAGISLQQALEACCSQVLLQAADAAGQPSGNVQGLMAHFKSRTLHQAACHCCRRSTQLRPHDARMWCAMGQCYENEQLKAVDQDKMELAAIQCYSRAVANGDREGIALHKLVRGTGSQPRRAGMALHGVAC